MSPKRPHALPHADVFVALKALPGWSFVHDKLHFEHKFEDFQQAFSFLQRVAEIAHELDHHPEIYNAYNLVRLDLSTHDTEPRGGGVTELDLKFATQTQLSL